jgi:hypothetical protein
MSSATTTDIETTSGLCASCGTPVDSQYFDDSSVQPKPDQGEELVLARFDLPAQYCGVLQYFTQFTDAFAVNASQIATPAIEWKVLVNNHALFPYVNLRHIVNPWGFGSYAVNIRLDEGAIVELVARGVVPDITTGIPPGEDVTLVGGRLVGRFWYNAAYGDVR